MLSVTRARGTAAGTPASGSRRSPRQRAVFATGVGLLLAGAAALTYVGWELVGTNIVAHGKQEAAVEDLVSTWADDRNEPTAESGRIPLGQASALIRVPAFGSDYVMPVFEGTSDDVLSKGFGHFSQTAGPGQRGNYAVAAHRITHGEPLRDMPELVPGDEVVVETQESTYTYELETDPNDLVIPFTDTWVLEDRPRNPDGGAEPSSEPGARLLTLTTCAELTHTDDRMVAFARLVDVHPRS